MPALRACWQYIFDVSVIMESFWFLLLEARGCCVLSSCFTLFLKLIWFGHQHYMSRLWYRMSVINFAERN